MRGAVVMKPLDAPSHLAPRTSHRVIVFALAPTISRSHELATPGPRPSNPRERSGGRRVIWQRLMISARASNDILYSTKKIQ